MGVDHVGCAGPGQQPTHLMGFFADKAEDPAAAKEATELNLAERVAHLGHNRRGRQGNDARFESDTVVVGGWAIHHC
jgi:hypothetical protein